MEFYIYSLIGTTLETDWTDFENNFPEKQTEKVLAEVVVNDPSDNICIGAKGADGKYHQFDSYEAYHADNYFRNNPEWKLKIITKKYRISDADLIKYEIPNK